MIFLESVLLEFFVCRFLDVIFPQNSFIDWNIYPGCRGVKFCADGRQSIDKISFAVILIGMDIFGTLLKMSCSKSG